MRFLRYQDSGVIKRIVGTVTYSVKLNNNSFKFLTYVRIHLRKSLIKFILECVNFLVGRGFLKLPFQHYHNIDLR